MRASNVSHYGCELAQTKVLQNTILYKYAGSGDVNVSILALFRRAICLKQHGYENGRLFSTLRMCTFQSTQTRKTLCSSLIINEKDRLQKKLDSVTISVYILRITKVCECTYLHRTEQIIKSKSPVIII